MDYTGVFILVVSFIILLSMGVPIAFSIGISGIFTMLVTIDSLPAFTTFAQRMATGLEVGAARNSPERREGRDRSGLREAQDPTKAAQARLLPPDRRGRLSTVLRSGFGCP